MRSLGIENRLVFVLFQHAMFPFIISTAIRNVPDVSLHPVHLARIHAPILKSMSDMKLNTQLNNHNMPHIHQS